jgi:hypothetical protein
MDQNPNRTSLDLTSLLPLGVGVLSLFGICLILLVGRMFSPRSTVLPPMTATPFKYLFVATEPGISSAVPTDTSTPDGTFEAISTDIFDPALDVTATSTRRTGFAITAVSGLATLSSSLPGEAPTDSSIQQSTSTPFSISSRAPAFTPTPRSTATALVLVTNTNSPLVVITNTLPVVNRTATATRTIPTSTSVSVAPLNAGTYDDNDSHLIYNGNWTSQSGVPGAYKETLHVSTTLDNSVTFRFIGQELRLFFQSGPSLGRLRVTIDGTQYDVDQSTNTTSVSEWVSARMTSATHTVTISHASGGSVNLDQIIVPELILTVTPSATATVTP